MDRIYYKEIAPDYYVTVVDGVKIELGKEYKFFPNDRTVRFEEMNLEVPNRTIKIRFIDAAWGGFILHFSKIIPPFDIMKMNGTIWRMKDVSKSKNLHNKSVCNFLNSLDLGYTFDTSYTTQCNEGKYRVWWVGDSASTVVPRLRTEIRKMVPGWDQISSRLTQNSIGRALPPVLRCGMRTNN